MDIYTLTAAAQEIGCHKSQVSRHAAKLGLGRVVGTIKLLTAGDVAKIRRSLAAAQPGNPRRNAKTGRFSGLEKVAKKSR